MRRTIGKRHGLESKSLRTHKRRKAIGIVLTIISVPSLLFALFSYLSYANFSQINFINIIGNQTIQASVVQALAEEKLSKPIGFFFSRNNIVMYPKDDIVAAIASSSQRVKSIAVSVSGLNTLKVSIIERTPQALWCNQNNECSFIDDTGLLFEKVGIDPLSDLFVFQGYVEDNHVPYFSNALDLMKGIANIDLKPQYMTITPENDAEILLKNGTTLKIALSDKPEDRIDALRTLFYNTDFKKKFDAGLLLYVDLRFGTKVYFKAK